MITIKRIYDTPSKSDGYRILVDKLWPRGVSKQKAKLDLWLKDIAPSDELRTWFSHDPKKWTEFKRKYKTELKKKSELITQLQALEKKHKTITLLYGAKDTEHNHARVVGELV